MNTFLPLLSTSFIVISAILVAVGWVLIRRKRTEAHRKLMTAASIFAVLFFLIYISRTLFVGNTSFGGPEHLRIYYLIFLLFHIVLALVAAVLGLVTLYLAYRKNYRAHRKIGPWTSVVWFFTAITGVTVYILLYVMYPGGETKPVLDAIFGT